MIAPQKWFERTWEFTLPPSRFPCVLERLRGAPDRLGERTRGVGGALHPRLGVPMRLIDLALFTVEHDDHHLAVISALRRRWGVR